MKFLYINHPGKLQMAVSSAVSGTSKMRRQNRRNAVRKLSSTFLSPLPIFSWRFHATINLYSTYIPTSDSPSTTRAVADIPSITSAVGHVRCNDISGCKLGFKSTNLNFVRNIFFGPQGCQCTYIDEDNGFVQLQPRVGRVMMAFTSAAVEMV